MQALKLMRSKVAEPLDGSNNSRELPFRESGPSHVDAIGQFG